MSQEVVSESHPSPYEVLHLQRISWYSKYLHKKLLKNIGLEMVGGTGDGGKSKRRKRQIGVSEEWNNKHTNKAHKLQMFRIISVSTFSCLPAIWWDDVIIWEENRTEQKRCMEDDKSLGRINVELEKSMQRRKSLCIVITYLLLLWWPNLIFRSSRHLDVWWRRAVRTSEFKKQ